MDLWLVDIEKIQKDFFFLFPRNEDLRICVSLWDRSLSYFVWYKKFESRKWLITFTALHPMTSNAQPISVASQSPSVASWWVSNCQNNQIPISWYYFLRCMTVKPSLVLSGNLFVLFYPIYCSMGIVNFIYSFILLVHPVINRLFHSLLFSIMYSKLVTNTLRFLISKTRIGVQNRSNNELALIWNGVRYQPFQCHACMSKLILVRGLSGVRFGLQSYEWLQNRPTSKRESDLLNTSRITDRHRTTRSPLTN